MRLDAFEQEPLRALQYVERYVNDGSPSGFTGKHACAPATNPFGLTPWYHLYSVAVGRESLESFGEVPEFLPVEEQVGKDWFVVHPDMAVHADLGQLYVVELENLRVVPTSSGRTVQMLAPAPNNYIKLHYDGVLGRIDRKLPRTKAISGVEVSNHILEAISRNVMPASFCVLHEAGAKILSISKGGQGNAKTEWGLVWRESKPRGQAQQLIAYLVPLFALFSVDRLRPYDAPLLKPIVTLWQSKASSYLIEGILFSILDSYFALLLQLGFQMEMNAQNLLVGFDGSWRPVATVVRDMMGTEKDLTLRAKRGLPVEFESAPYKCIAEDEDAKLYRIRHSFVFDFKVGRYVLDPIIDCASGLGCVNAQTAVSALRARSKDWIDKLPQDFFPTDGQWYRHDRVLLTQTREYVPDPSPRYR